MKYNLWYLDQAKQMQSRVCADEWAAVREIERHIGFYDKSQAVTFNYVNPTTRMYEGYWGRIYLKKGKLIASIIPTPE
jgi:hypothetical protein